MKKCPKCGNDLVGIIYGLPDPELCDAAERGEVVLGGCCIMDDGPSLYCKNCKVGYSYSLGRSFNKLDF